MASQGSNRDDLLKALLEAHRTEYYTSWGSSYFEASGHTPWTILGAGPVPPQGPQPDTITIDPNFNEVLPAAGPYISKLFQVSGSADTAVVSLLAGYGRLHDQSFSVNTALDESGPIALCLKQGGCKCPDGSPGASEVTQKTALPQSIRLNGAKRRRRSAL